MITRAIYHYTGLDAFSSIMETGRIRATHYREFGDKEELQLGIRLLHDAVKQHEVEPCDKEYRDFLIEGIEGFAEGTMAVYVLSLTELRDSLHHWRTYAPTGVAIGFCGDVIRTGFTIDISRRMRGAPIDNPVRADPANRFMECRYVSQFDLAGLVSNRFFTENSYPAAFRHQHMREHSAFSACLSVSIYQTICAIKGEGFAEDVEWRFVHINPNAEDYPVRTENNREFIELQFAPIKLVSEVWVGPHNQKELCIDAIDDFRQRDVLQCSALASSLQLLGNKDTSEALVH